MYLKQECCSFLLLAGGYNLSWPGTIREYNCLSLTVFHLLPFNLSEDWGGWEALRIGFQNKVHTKGKEDGSGGDNWGHNCSHFIELSFQPLRRLTLWRQWHKCFFVSIVHWWMVIITQDETVALMSFLCSPCFETWLSKVRSTHGADLFVQKIKKSFVLPSATVMWSVSQCGCDSVDS